MAKTKCTSKLEMNARMVGCQLTSMAARLEYDAKDYDVHFLNEYIRDLKNMSEKLLSAK